MQFDDTFPKKLERMLNLRNNHMNAEVINFGVPGFSTYHEIETFRKAAKIGSDLILLQVTLNDPQLKPYVPSGITGVNPFGELRSGENLRTLYSYWKSLGYAARRLHNSRTHRNYKDYYFKLFERKSEWSTFSKAIKRMIRRAKKQDITFAAIIFPIFGLPLDSSYPFIPLHKKIEELFSSEQVAVLDLLPNYRNLPLSRIQLIPGQDFHPNEIGHRLAAEAIYNWLEEKKMVPKELFIKNKYQIRLNINGLKNKPFPGNG